MRHLRVARIEPKIVVAQSCIGDRSGAYSTHPCCSIVGGSRVGYHGLGCI